MTKKTPITTFCITGALEKYKGDVLLKYTTKQMQDL